MTPAAANQAIKRLIDDFADSLDSNSRSRPSQPRKRRFSPAGLLSLAELSLFSPPHWRWDVACKWVESGQDVPKGLGGPEMRRALILARYAKAKETGRRVGKKPDHAALCAYGIYIAGGPPMWKLQAAILAGLDETDAGLIGGVDANVAEAFELLFFNVRPRMQGHGWLWRVFGHKYGTDALLTALEVIRPDRQPLLKEDFAELETAEGRRRFRVRLSAAIEMLGEDRLYDRSAHRLTEQLTEILTLVNDYERSDHAKEQVDRLVAQNAAILAATSPPLLCPYRR